MNEWRFQRWGSKSHVYACTKALFDVKLCIWFPRHYEKDDRFKYADAIHDTVASHTLTFEEFYPLTLNDLTPEELMIILEWKLHE